MNKRAGARQIDGKKSKKEKRVERLRALDRSKSQPEVLFRPLEDGLWEVSNGLKPINQPQAQPKEPQIKRFDLRGFLDDVRSAITRRNDLGKAKS